MAALRHGRTSSSKSPSAAAVPHTKNSAMSLAPSLQGRWREQSETASIEDDGGGEGGGRRERHGEKCRSYRPCRSCRRFNHRNPHTPRNAIAGSPQTNTRPTKALFTFLIRLPIGPEWRQRAAIGTAKGSCPPGLRDTHRNLGSSGFSSKLVMYASSVLKQASFLSGDAALIARRCPRRATAAPLFTFSHQRCGQSPDSPSPFLFHEITSIEVDFAVASQSRPKVCHLVAEEVLPLVHLLLLKHRRYAMSLLKAESSATAQNNHTATQSQGVVVSVLHQRRQASLHSVRRQLRRDGIASCLLLRLFLQRIRSWWRQHAAIEWRRRRHQESRSPECFRGRIGVKRADGRGSQ